MAGRHTPNDRSLIDSGQLPAFGVGRVIQVKPEDLTAFLEANRV